MTRQLLLFALLAAGSFGANARKLPDDCSFDQAAIAERLQALSARVPGGVVDLKEASVSWRLDSGDVVEAGQGGCYDLGVGISITYAKGRPATKIAVSQLLRVISEYWSERDSAEVASILAARKFATEVTAEGEIELIAAPVPKSPFFDGFSMVISRSQISISWQSG